MTLRERLERRILDTPGAPLAFSDQEIDALTDDDIEYLRTEYGGRVLMRLPPREQAFFAWLKTEDPAVWNDLWEDDEDLLVTLAFLGELRQGANGFAICELVGNDNYYFTAKHIKPEGLEALNGILERAAHGESLSVAEGLLFEIVARPIDLWHFCRKYGVSLARGKQAVGELVGLDWLVHLPKREDLARYIEG